MLPNIRLKVSKEKKEEIKKILKLRPNKRLLQWDLLQDGFNLKLKDLANLQYQNKSVDGDNLKKAIEYLTQKQGKNHSI